MGGHLGIYKTRHKIREQLIWKGMDKDISSRVKACSTCALSKPAQFQRWGYLASSVAEHPMQKLFIDFVGKLPRTKLGNTYILVVVDAFTKLEEATSAAPISSLKNIFASFGMPPRSIVSDNATQFTMRRFKQFCFDLGIKHITTSPYYPNPSHAERVNRNLRSALNCFHSSNHQSWDTQLNWLQYAFNTARHESHSNTPFSLMMTYKPNSPLSNLWQLSDLLPDHPTPGEIRETWSRAANNLKMSHQRLARKYNSQRRPANFKVGDKVYVRNYPQSRRIDKFAAKLAPRFRGPFSIVSFTSPVSVRLQDVNGSEIRAHISQLKGAE